LEIETDPSEEALIEINTKHGSEINCHEI